MSSENKFFCNIQKQPQEVFSENDALKIFFQSSQENTCASLFFNKTAGLRPVTLLKNRLWHRCFSVNLMKFLRASFFTENLERLCLNIAKTLKKNLEEYLKQSSEQVFSGETLLRKFVKFIENYLLRSLSVR